MDHHVNLHMLITKWLMESSQRQNCIREALPTGVMERVTRALRRKSGFDFIRSNELLRFVYPFYGELDLQTKNALNS